MQEWCMAHPWMTFFILMSLFSLPPRMVIVFRNKKE
jgi:hypothetical protein